MLEKQFYCTALRWTDSDGGFILLPVLWTKWTIRPRFVVTDTIRPWTRSWSLFNLVIRIMSFNLNQNNNTTHKKPKKYLIEKFKKKFRLFFNNLCF